MWLRLIKPESRWELSKRTKAEIFEDFPPLEQNTLILLTKGLQCSCLFQNGKEIFPEKRPRLIWSISFAYRRSAVKGLKYISCIVIQLFIHISYTDCNTIVFTYIIHRLYLHIFYTDCNTIVSLNRNGLVRYVGEVKRPKPIWKLIKMFPRSTADQTHTTLLLHKKLFEESDPKISKTHTTSYMK